MNAHAFFLTIERFNNGNIKFNLGKNWSFLLNNNWYPSRAFMNAYFAELGEDGGHNLHQSVFELTKFIPITSAYISYNNHLPISNLTT
jgi:hypothetical protein